MPESPRIPELKEVASLPRWARVAYAARCARRVQPLVNLHWPGSLTAQRAAAARTSDADAFAIVSVVASSALAVHRAGYDLIIGGLWSDFLSLRNLAAREEWTDSTQVPQSVFGPLWPDGEPNWHQAGMAELAGELKEARARDEAWAKFELHTRPQLEEVVADLLGNITPAVKAKPRISVIFDDSGFTEQEVETFLSYLAETYRELGGAGLKVVGGDTLTPAVAEVLQ